VKFSNHIGGYNAFLVFTPRICQRKKLAYIYFTLLDKCISCEFQPKETLAQCAKWAQKLALLLTFLASERKEEGIRENTLEIKLVI
jgi:hypothetical protein